MSDSRPIFLVGFMGSGKSAVGRILAAATGRDFFDTDALVEQREGRTIEQIFRRSGEESFRHLEWEVLRGLAGSSRIVATGGGLFASVAPREFMLREGATVWLDAPLELIRERVEGGVGRPMWVENDDAKLREFFHARRATYALAAHRIDATGSAEEVAERVRSRIPSLFR